MSINIESPHLASIWSLVEKLTPLEKLSLSELLTADVRKQLLATEQSVSHFVELDGMSSQQIDESDEWSDEDLVELREASMYYMTETIVAKEQVNVD